MYINCSVKEWPISLDMACNNALSTVACSFQFTNIADKDLYLLKRNTPLDGLNSKCSHHLYGRLSCAI